MLSTSRTSMDVIYLPKVILVLILAVQIHKASISTIKHSWQGTSAYWFLVFIILLYMSTSACSNSFIVYVKFIRTLGKQGTRDSSFMFLGLGYL